jgi:hypothetical protein
MTPTPITTAILMIASKIKSVGLPPEGAGLAGGGVAGAAFCSATT